MGWLEKTRADYQIDVALFQSLDKPADFGGAVLSVAIHLHGHVIAVQRRIAIARLHRAADSEIKRQADDRDTRRDLADGVIGGAIVNHQHVKVRQRPAQAGDHLADRARLVEHRDDHQIAIFRRRREIGTMGTMHGRIRIEAV